MKRADWATKLSLALLAAAVAVPLRADTAHPDSAAEAARTRHVIVISVDGLRPDAIERFGLDTMERLAREGSFATDARTILPSKTLPSHTSMVTGLEPADHGITFNRDVAEEENVQVPTMFELARESGLTTAAFYSKAKLRHLERPDAYDYSQAPGSNADNWMATRTVADAVQYLEHARPNLLFVHIGEPDYAGHTTGWMSVFYGWATKRADAGVARVIRAAEDAFGAGNFTVILTADHGGHEGNHGSDSEEDLLIPWIAWGQGVVPGTQPAGVRTYDTAATALWLLGVPFPAHWAGRPVEESFVIEPKAMTAGSAAGA